MKSKILILGIDGGNWRVLRGAIERGYMPFLGQLVGEGASGVLESTFPAITPAAWSAFHSGRDVGTSGIFNFAWWDRQTHRHRFFDSHAVEPTVWQLLSENGYRVGLLNVPMTYPPSELNGWVVSGMLTPSMEARFTHPGELKTALLEHLPRYETIRSDSAGRYQPHEDPEGFMGEMAQAVEMRASAAEFLFARDPVDISMVHFQASDLIFHAFWHHLDPDHPLFDRDAERRIMEGFFRPLDDALARARRAFAAYCGSEHTCFVISDHGFERHEKAFLLGDWLCREGYLVLNPRNARPPVVKRLTKRLGVGKLLSRVLSSKTITAAESRLRLDAEPFVWQKSRAFAMGRGADGFIYLLESDPQARGRTAAELIAKLGAIQIPGTDLTLAQRVCTRAEVYGPSAPDSLPDVILATRPSHSCTGGYLGESGLFRQVRPGRDFHIGRHHPDGIFIGVGGGIVSCSSLRFRLVDMPATLLNIAGFSAPDYMDSTPVRQLLAEGPSCEGLRQPSLLESEPPESSDTYSDEEQDQVSKRLKDLGYL